MDLNRPGIPGGPKTRDQGGGPPFAFRSRLIGGQMVLLHALQARRTPRRVSQDLDAVIDARVRPPALTAFLATLAGFGFSSAGVSPDEVAHRFQRGTVQ